MLNFFDRMQIFQPLCNKYPLVRRFFCRSEPLVYADTSNLTPILEAVLVLSPSDYWALEVNLNVKTPKEAATYGAALFDLSDEYRYDAQKIGNNSYILIAYNPNEISQRVLSLPHFSMIQKVTFAQWVFAQEPHPIHLPSGKYLTTLEGIVIEMDASYIDAATSVELDEALAHSRPFLKTVQIEGFVSSQLTQKTLRTTLVILILLLGNLVAEGILGYQESSKLTTNIQRILESSKLPETSIEREAILEALKSKENKQLHFRSVCKEISDLPMEAKTVATPVVAPALSTRPSASPEGIVLIPGSKPGEANRLLVENSSSAATIVVRGEGMQELGYDGNAINLIIDTRDLSTGGKLKNEITKKFKHAQVSEHTTQLEVRLK